MNPLELSTASMFAEAVCDRHGLTPGEWEALVEKGGAALRSMREEHEKGGLGFLDLPHRAEEATRILDWARERREGLSDVVVLGIGGSALGTIALAEALCHPAPPGAGAVRSEPPRAAETRPRLHVLDTVDPEAVLPVLDGIDPSRSLFCSVSKSGATPETLAQTLLAVEHLQGELGGDWRRHLVAITDPQEGPLRRLASAQRLDAFPIPPGVGGRFSVLSPAGLVPAALLGIDILALLEGASTQDLPGEGEAAAGDPASYGPAAYGMAQFGLASSKGCRIHVLMPYANALYRVADWYRQLLAESLGKKRTLDGRKVAVTPTPVKAIGPTDQHSQAQLYMEGSHDKTVTFLAVRHPRCDRAIPAAPADLAASASLLEGVTLHELLGAELEGTAAALTEAHRPNCRITLERIDARSIGALLQFLEVSVALEGRLMGIDAFNQPGVELGKVRTREILTARRGPRAS